MAARFDKFLGQLKDSSSAIADVVGLQATLDGKAPSAHAHTAAQISDATAVGRGLLMAANSTDQRTLLGLSAVDNTADAQKPVSTAQAAAIAAATTADAIADTLEIAPPADLARIQASVSGAGTVSGVTYDGSNRVTGYSANGIAYVVAYPNPTTVTVAGNGKTITVTLDSQGRVIGKVVA